ncbi:11943_t:CDS:1 [Acaulospora morrowiae]|uniref:11943_t:CDS:1 n=1 Tax=Acaulospora morrowiae TaxID=94023 RepID=A0A9N9HRZ3_9GLOM|nr:11943_t:CDS:1 [Acaulospora morrowiae]
MGKKYIAQSLVQKLKKSNYLIATIESCTGGLVANLITDITGSSQVFWGGRVVYDNNAKIALGVDPSIIDTHGAVSYETARSLAEKGLAELQKHSMIKGDNDYNDPKHFICVATTGLAEQDPDKNLEGGVCWIGIASSNINMTFVERVNASPLLTREETKLEFAKKALKFVEKNI